jgi:flagellar basal-body rod protein FlgC
MDTIPVAQISASGMNLERARVEMAMLRLSLVDVSFSSAGEAKAFANNIQSNFSALLTEGNGISNYDVKEVKDPNNGKADEQGNVYYLQIDPTKEMATLISATRAYEANTRAYNANSQMTRSALEIGGK